MADSTADPGDCAAETGCAGVPAGIPREAPPSGSPAALARSIGWLLLIGGVLAMVGFAIYALVVDREAPLYIKLGVAGVYGGLALLLLSVLRQRLIARKTDKYKDVQI